MKYHKRILILVLIMSVLAGTLSGCGEWNISAPDASEEEFIGLEEEPDLNYEIPKSNVGISQQSQAALQRTSDRPS